MIRRVLSLFLLFAWGGANFARAEEPFLLAQNSLNDKQKREMFLNAREDIQPSPAAAPKSTATPKPKPKPSPTPAKKATPKPSPTPSPKASPSKPKKEEADKPDETKREKSEEPKPQAGAEKPSPAAPAVPEKPVARDLSMATDFIPPASEALIEKEKPVPAPSEPTVSREALTPLPTLPVLEKKDAPAPVTPPITKPTPASRFSLLPRYTAPKAKPDRNAQEKADLTIEKSGRQEDEGLQEAPPKQRLFGRRWSYLSESVRRAIDQAPVRKGRWKYIIVHNSATRQGNAAIFDNYHRRVRKMENGMAYHFVIGNGSSSGNGQIEIGDRWKRQINGGHVASDYLNDISLGICLVGDYDRDLPTPQQMAALRELLTYLRARVGKIKGEYSQVRGHREINPKPTTCPGTRFPIGIIRREYQ